MVCRRAGAVERQQCMIPTKISLQLVPLWVKVLPTPTPVLRDLEQSVNTSSQRECSADRE